MQIGGILPTCSKLFAWQIKGVDGNTLSGFNFQILNLKKIASCCAKKSKQPFYFHPKIQTHQILIWQSKQT